MNENKPMSEKESIPFYPEHIRSEAKVVAGIILVVLLIGMWGLSSPMGIGDPADPMNTPAHVKPEWYFLALYQLLKFIPKTTGAVIPVIGMLLVVLLPFIDRKPERSKKVQRARLILVILGVIAMIALTIWGEVS